MPTEAERELEQAIRAILDSKSPKKLVIAGPGAGKTTLFRKLLEAAPGTQESRLVITFINNLKTDLEGSLGDLSEVFTLHGYCQYLLRHHEQFRNGLGSDFVCYPGLVSIIKEDWQWLQGTDAPKFVDLMRNLKCEEEEKFYFDRAKYYNAVDFDDSVYRIFRSLSQNPDAIPRYDLVLIDEFQDFNLMEASVIDLLSRSPIVIAGDDDQALYSRLRAASWDHIRARYRDGEYEVFLLPFCMRCTEVIVAAVDDVITKARELKGLSGRIDKPYKYFEPAKGADSRKYPKIALAETSVQRLNANYFGRYVERAIRAIPKEELAEAAAKKEAAVLIIGSKPYMPQIERHLVEAGLIKVTVKSSTKDREKALYLIHKDNSSNLGWRIILGLEGATAAAPLVRSAAEKNCKLIEFVSEQFRNAILKESAEWVAKNKVTDELLDAEASELSPAIKLTSYEGAKGLSAQHVFLIGVHADELPKDAANIQDIEICRFLVGLTRTKKKCSIVLTKRFGKDFRQPSAFIRWIDSRRFEPLTVDAKYWAHS